MNPFAQKLSELITADGRTVARIAREGGLVASTLHCYKSGTRTPGPAKLRAILAALRLPAHHPGLWAAYKLAGLSS